ncbi:hypothetical protein [Brevundimonas sp. M20]|uniref:hypothetical protein n=1 Tax=Brevundimonas sp. M20 TaxID=2591463 RepID=UPI0011461A0D|nr:hypothetical protein [Brevundimonas sp. M20]QDH72017.1 hypothetical protein FKQ52_00445 [Brevundimonas sp. M20]
MLVMLGLPALVWGIVALLGRGEWSAITAAASLLISWPASWLTWSFLVTRWRLWAYERVENLDELKAVAVEAKLIWPEGHARERTEIRSPSQKQRISEYEAAWARKRG